MQLTVVPQTVGLDKEEYHRIMYQPNVWKLFIVTIYVNLSTFMCHNILSIFAVLENGALGVVTRKIPICKTGDVLKRQ